MVHTVCFLASLFGSDPIRSDPGSKDEPTPPGVEVQVETERPLDRDSVREWYLDLSRRTSKRRRQSASEAVPELVALHEVLSGVDGLSAAEKQRMRAVIRGRLEWYEHRLRRELADAKRSVRRDASISRGTKLGGENEVASNAGPGTLGAAGLIELIQRIVNPPIWDVNGGPAGIGYFSPLQALVVRAPGEVHYQLGGTLEQVRRAAR